MDVLIRPARPAELDAIGTLTVDVYGGERLAGEDYLPVLADTGARAAAPLTEVVVAVEPTTGEVQGSLTYCRFGSPFADLALEGEAEVRMLAVNAGSRRRGIGEALVLDAVERGKADGCERLVLFTMLAMRDAQRLYDRLGFARVPERDLTLRNGFRLLAYSLDL
jgi:ribosomal protein S18 acetylase RimI-like enzyme